MFRLASISTRNQFGPLLVERGLTGNAVEVGTHRGDFARVLLNSWPGRLHCIDPWSIPIGYGDQAKLLWGGGSRDDDFDATKLCLLPHSSRVEFYKMTSEDAVGQFAGGSLDFVYVDGDHRFEHVLADLTAWWARLKPGGILAGHDWIQPGEEHRWADEIQRALSVFLFARTALVDVELVVEENGLPWSFYMIKPAAI
jgi:hypothetical protein